MKRARDDGDSTTTQGRDDVDCLTKDSIVKYEHQVGKQIIHLINYIDWLIDDWSVRFLFVVLKCFITFF